MQLTAWGSLFNFLRRTHVIIFRNVHYYRIAGRYAFAGDLVIVRGALYFFPEVDPDAQHSRAAESVPGELSLVTAAVVYLAQKASFYAARTHDLRAEGVTDDRFRQEADACLEEAKRGRGR